MRHFLLLCYLIGIQGVYAQIVLKGKVVDASTAAPISFVNIGILGKSIGTVSNTNGAFQLRIPENRVSGEDVLRFSTLGYAPKEIPFSVLTHQNSVVIRLDAAPIALDEVVLSALPMYQMEEMVGLEIQREFNLAYWKDSLALGAELASRIRVPKGMRKLNTLFFRVIENPSDSILIRVNAYAYESRRSMPGKNLNRSEKNILHTIYKGASEVVVDLKPYDLWVEDDFVLSLELLSVYGSDVIVMSLPAGSDNRGKTFRRYASQGSFEAIGSQTVAFQLQSTFYTNSERQANNPKILRRHKRKQGVVSGFIFFGRIGLSDIRIENLNMNTRVRSDARGRYEIEASPGDILRFTREGTKPVLRRIKAPGNLSLNFKSL